MKEQQVVEREISSLERKAQLQKQNKTIRKLNLEKILKRQKKQKKTDNEQSSVLKFDGDASRHR